MVCVAWRGVRSLALSRSPLLGDLYGTSGVFDAIRGLTVSGDAQTCRAAIDRLADSGADAVVLQPIHRNEEEQIERIGHHLLRRHDSPAPASSS
jgi:alkanesulfonate monooxygenase SsuD/methylene tetrahydromethanopterin reductase-like flavin-dependent oxidoreductase (luciferase family)